MAVSPERHLEAAPHAGALDVGHVRAQFPILKQEINGHPLAYLDNAATTQKPQRVIDAVHAYYTRQNSNVHRGVHTLSQQATNLYEAGRERVQHFINASVPCEIVFTRGATEAINLVAESHGRTHVGEGDEVLITHMEHHSNIVPWQMLCERQGAKLKVVPIHDDGSLDMDAFDLLLTERTKIVGVVHVSNALGTVNPVREIIAKAHAAGAVTVLDAAQSVPHMGVDVQELGCDFMAFSGHKMYGPTGIGVLYGKASLLEAMPPYQGGGDMILSVSFEKTIYNYLPQKFEAGTPHIEGVIGLAAAVDFLEETGMEAIAAHERDLLDYGAAELAKVDGVKLVGTAPEKAGVLSFLMEHAHPHDIGQILDDYGVAIRAGHHCAQPVMKRYGIPATTRASLGVYNTREDIDALTHALGVVNEVFH